MSNKTLRKRLLFAIISLLVLSPFSPGRAEAPLPTMDHVLLIAQAGSMGGTVGNDDKSVSGTQRSASPAMSPVTHKTPAPDESVRARRARATTKLVAAPHAESGLSKKSSYRNYSFADGL
jgi:hypothetical protein